MTRGKFIIVSFFELKDSQVASAGLKSSLGPCLQTQCMKRSTALACVTLSSSPAHGNGTWQAKCCHSPYSRKGKSVLVTGDVGLFYSVERNFILRARLTISVLHLFECSKLHYKFFYIVFLTRIYGLY